MLEEKSNTNVIENEIIPFLKIFYIENTLKIDHQKIINSTQYIPISLLASLQAVAESNASNFYSIDWLSLGLLKRIEHLKLYFCAILQAEIDKKDTTAIKLSLNDDGIFISLTRDEILWWPEITPKHRVSPDLAIIMLNTIIQEERQKKRIKNQQELTLSREELRKHNLKQLNLTAELSRDLRRLHSNNPVMLIPEKLPQRIWLKYLANYLAISSKLYPDYGDVIYEDENLLNNARGIHSTLIELSNIILGITLREPCLMLREHLEIAKKAGITDIAVVATNPERTIRDDWSVEVTKEFALKLLHQLPEFNYLFDHDIHGSTIKHPKIPDIPEHPIVYVVNNNDNRVINNIDARTSNNIKVLFSKEPIITPSHTAKTQKTQSSRKDAISEALSRIILPELHKNGQHLTKDINFTKLCWEKLPEALKQIGCTDIKLSKDGNKDEHTIQSKHGSLNTPLITFHAFRQRINRMVESAI